MTETAEARRRTPGTRELAYAVGVVCVIGLLVQLVALRFAVPTNGVVTDAQVVQNPQNPTNAVGYTVYLAIAGIAVLALKELPISGVLDYLAALLVWNISAVLVFRVLELGVLPSAVLGLVAMYAYIQFHPWWVVNATAIAFGAYAAAVLGMNFGVLPAVLLLAGTALFDYIAVYRSGHMIRLADAIDAGRVPIPAMLTIPTSWAFVDEPERHADECFKIGLGDFVIPAVLVVSAAVWFDGAALEVVGVVLPWAALGALLGVLAGKAGVIYVLYSTDGPLPALPFINTGAVAGLLVGLAVGVVA